ncbi:hypothetical protein D3C71_1603530 [compost metagenome]
MRDLHGRVRSANHNDALPAESLWIPIFGTVKVSATEVFESWNIGYIGTTKGSRCYDHGSCQYALSVGGRYLEPPIFLIYPHDLSILENRQLEKVGILLQVLHHFVANRVVAWRSRERQSR